MDITSGTQTVTAAGPVAGVLNTSGLTQPIDIRVDFGSVSAGTTARIEIQDTVDALPFDDAQTVYNFTIGHQYTDPATGATSWVNAAGSGANPVREQRATAGYGKLGCTALAYAPVDITADPNASQGIRSGSAYSALRVNVTYLSPGGSFTIHAYTI